VKNGATDVSRTDRFFTIPNLLSLLRLVLVVPFVLVLIAHEPWSKPWAIAIVLVAALTDKLDGDLARKYGQESEWGRILDPLADKLGIAAAAIVFLVLDLLPAWFVAALVGRDLLIGAGGLYLKARTGRVLPSNMAGKWAVGVFILTILVILLEAPPVVVSVMIGASIVMLLVSLFMYIRRFIEAAFKAAGEGPIGSA